MQTSCLCELLNFCTERYIEFHFMCQETFRSCPPTRFSQPLPLFNLISAPRDTASKRIGAPNPYESVKFCTCNTFVVLEEHFSTNCDRQTPQLQTQLTQERVTCMLQRVVLDARHIFLPNTFSFSVDLLSEMNESVDKSWCRKTNYRIFRKAKLGGGAPCGGNWNQSQRTVEIFVTRFFLFFKVFSCTIFGLFPMPANLMPVLVNVHCVSTFHSTLIKATRLQTYFVAKTARDVTQQSNFVSWRLASVWRKIISG